MQNTTKRCETQAWFRHLNAIQPGDGSGLFYSSQDQYGA